MARRVDYRLPHDRGFMLWRSNEGTRWLEESIERWVFAMLADDEVSSPITPDEEKASFTVISRHEGVLAGAWAVDYMIASRTSDIETFWYFGDGDARGPDETVAIVSGGRKSILMLERSILNLIGQLSGIATNSAKWATTSPIPVACTRKTVWGLLDKWAVHLGGGLTHRLSKRDACMLKENDITSEIDSEYAIKHHIEELDDGLLGSFLTVEVRSVGEAVAAASTWKEKDPHRKCVILMDNLGPDGVREADVALRENDLRENVILEGSGGITFESLVDWKDCGVDVLSSSLLNRAISPHDFSMMIEGA